MFQVLAAGGWVMPFIVVCSVLALAICIERHFALNKQRIAPPHLLATVWQQLQGEGLDAQKLKALRQGSQLAPFSQRAWPIGTRAVRSCERVFARRHPTSSTA